MILDRLGCKHSVGILRKTIWLRLTSFFNACVCLRNKVRVYILGLFVRCVERAVAMPYSEGYSCTCCRTRWPSERVIRGDSMVEASAASYVMEEKATPAHENRATFETSNVSNFRLYQEKVKSRRQPSTIDCY